MELLQSASIYDTIEVDGHKCILIPVSDLEAQHRAVISEAHRLRQWLKYPKLMTAKKMRSQA